MKIPKILVLLSILLSACAENESVDVSQDHDLESTEDSINTEAPQLSYESLENEVYYMGRIDGQYNFTMKLASSSSDLEGYYYYWNVGTRIGLSGTEDQGGIDLTETGDQNPEKFSLFESDMYTFDGSWQKNDDSNKLDVYLNEIDDETVFNLAQLDELTPLFTDYLKKPTTKNGGELLTPGQIAFLMPYDWGDWSINEDKWAGENSIKAAGMLRFDNFLLFVLDLNLATALEGDETIEEAQMLITATHTGSIVSSLNFDGHFYSEEYGGIVHSVLSHTVLDKSLKFMISEQLHREESSAEFFQTNYQIDEYGEINEVTE